MICPQCHTPNREGDRFCEQCGSPLDGAMEQPFGAESQIAATLMAASPSSSVLVRVGEGAEQQRYPLGTRVVIGRLDSCDIPIHDKSVSREHARLSRLRDGYVIEDLGSTNGTLVNGNRIDEATLLHNGDAVTIGAIDFRFEQEAPKAAEAPFLSPWETPQGRPEDVFLPQPAEPSEAPTLRDLPPISEPFPTTSPFSASPGFDSTPSAAPEAPQGQGGQESSDQLDAMKAALGFTGQETGQDTAPQAPASPFEAPAPPFSSFPPPEAPPSWQESPPQAAQEVSAPPFSAPPPDVSTPSSTQPPPDVSTPSFSQATADVSTPSISQPTSAAAAPEAAGELVDEAQQVAYRLTELISDLASQLQDARNQVAQAQAELQDLQTVKGTLDQVKQVVPEAPGRSIASDHLASIRDMVNALVDNPRDVEVLMKVAQQGSSLATIIVEYDRLHGTLDRLTSIMGVSRGR